MNAEQQAELARLIEIAEATKLAARANNTAENQDAAVAASAEKAAFIQANGLWKGHGRGSRAGLRQQAERRAMHPDRRPDGSQF